MRYNMPSVTYNFRIDEDLKNESFEVIKSFGMTPAQAIKLFLKQTAETKTIPINFDYQPNAQTAKVLDEALAGQGMVGSFETVEELMESLDAQD